MLGRDGKLRFKRIHLRGEERVDDKMPLLISMSTNRK